jgi:membrane AbrB-like protein
MTQETLHGTSGWIEGSAPVVQWAALIALSLGFGAVLTWLGVPAAMLIGPLIAGIVISGNGGNLRLARQAFVPVQGIIGCMIVRMLPSSTAGELGVHWPIFAAGVLSVIMACSLALIAVCGGVGAVLVGVAGIDPLTAYLATSPGGADSVAIIAASSNVDVRFVMAMQMARFVAVLAIGPLAARFFARRATAKTDAAEFRDR